MFREATSLIIDWTVKIDEPRLNRRFAWLEIALVGFGLLLIVALVLPAISQSREAARRTMSRHNLKQIGFAIQDYHQSYHLLPPGGTFRDDGTPLHSWALFLQPWMAQVAPYAVINHDIPWDDSVNWSPMRQGDHLWTIGFIDPSVPTTKKKDGSVEVHYAPNEWLMHRNSSVRLDQIPDSSTTMLMGDAFGDFAIFGDPVNWRNPLLPLRTSPGGFGHVARKDVTHIVYVDGRVNTLATETSPTVLAAMAGPEDLRPIPEQVARRTTPFRPPTEPVWTYFIFVCEHKTLGRLALSPDRRRLVVRLGSDCDLQASWWKQEFRELVKNAPIDHLDIEKQITADQLRLLREELPNLQVESERSE